MASGALPVVYVSGSNHEIGLQIGKTFRSLIQAAVQINKNLRNLLLPYYGTNEGDKVYHEYLKVAEEWVPQYVDELRGIAEGSHTPFHHLFLLLLEPEIVILAAKGVPETGGCTSIQLLTDDAALIAHTEDGCPELKEYGYVVHAHVNPTERNGYTEERFVSFCYPGMLVGNAYSVNSYGLAITGNIVKPSKVYAHGRIARRLVCRAIVAAKSAKNAAKIIRKLPGIGGGFHFNLGQKRRGQKQHNSEAAKLVVAHGSMDADSSEDKREKRKEKDDNSDSGSSYSGEEQSADNFEECEEMTDKLNGLASGDQTKLKQQTNINQSLVDGTEEDVRVEMLEKDGYIIEKEHPSGQLDHRDLDHLEEMIQKYLQPRTETVSRKYVQDVERMYSYRSSDGLVIEETIYPQVAYPLEAVRSGAYGDACDRKDDTSSSSDSDSSDEEAKKTKKKHQKKSSNSSGDEENSESEDDFEEAVEKHNDESAESDDEKDEGGATGDEQVTVEKHVKKEETKDGNKKEIVEEVIVTKKEEGSTEVITEKRVTVVKTEIVGDIDPEEKERIMQEMKDRLKRERENARTTGDSDSDINREDDDKKSTSSESDSQKKESVEESDQKIIEETLTVTEVNADDGNKEVITEKRVTVVTTEIQGDIDPEERERILQEMRDKMAEEREKLQSKRESGSDEEEKQSGTSDSESQSGEGSDSGGEKEPKRESESSGSEDEKEPEPTEPKEISTEESVTIIKEETEGDKVITEETVTVVKTEAVGDVAQDEKERIELGDEKIEDILEKSDSERDVENGRKKSDSSYSESDSEQKGKVDEPELNDQIVEVETNEIPDSRSRSESDEDKKRDKETTEVKEQVVEITIVKRKSTSDSSDSDSDSEKEKEKNNNEEKPEKDEQQPQEQPDIKQSNIESEEILVSRNAPNQQFTVPPGYEGNDREEKEEAIVESESESDSDLSDLEDWETSIRFGSLEVIGGENKTIIDFQDVTGFYCHTNRYLRLDGGMTGDSVEINSKTREDRVNELTAESKPKTVDDILSIMGDTSNPRYPIWRSGKFPDFWATMSLGVFNFITEELMIFRENPKTNPTYAAFQFPK